MAIPLSRNARNQRHNDMIERLKNWLIDRFSAADASAPVDFRKTGAHPSPRPRKPAATNSAPRKARPKQSAMPHAARKEIDDEPTFTGGIEDGGPGKNVLIRNKYVREDTGTHETLKILDDSLVDSGEEEGIDPYNTGGFDRSKNWNNRFRK